MNECVNHPLRPAIAKCRKCNQPICDQCSQEFGRFCSAQCAAEFQEFQSRIPNTSAVRRRRFSMLGCLRTFAISIVLSVIIWFALVQLLGTSNPGEMLVALKKMWKLAF